MRRLFAVSALVIAPFAFGKLELPRTASSNSVQAIVYGAMYAQFGRYQEQGGTNPIHSTPAGLIVQDDHAQMKCKAFSSMGLLQVMSYACTLTTEFEHSPRQIHLPWTMDAHSVQAVLFEAIREAYAERAQFGGLFTIKKTNNGYLVTDGKTDLRVAAGSPGMLTVMQYSLTLTIRN